MTSDWGTSATSAAGASAATATGSALAPSALLTGGPSPAAGEAPWSGGSPADKPGFPSTPADAWAPWGAAGCPELELADTCSAGAGAATDEAGGIGRNGSCSQCLHGCSGVDSTAYPGSPGMRYCRAARGCQCQTPVSSWENHSLRSSGVVQTLHPSTPVICGSAEASGRWVALLDWEPLRLSTSGAGALELLDELRPKLDPPAGGWATLIAAQSSQPPHGSSGA